MKNRLGVLGSSALQGSVLVITLLALFLRPKIAFWVFIGVPISFIGAFTFMGLLGISLNLMSAFGFIVVLGIVVDDAIVTGESVYQRLKSGDSGLDASVNGTLDVAVPVTFGVLTTMVAFSPLAFIEGRFGAIMGPVAAVVICVLLISLVESKLVLPAHLKGMGGAYEKESDNRLARWQRAFADGFEVRILRYYRPALEFLTRHRYATLVSFAGVLFVMVALVLSGWTRFTFMPRITGETATATLSMPAGTQFSVTERYVTQMFEAAVELQARYTDEATGESVIRHVLASTGSRRGSVGSNFGRVEIELIPLEHRSNDISTQEMVTQWRRLIGPVPGAESLTIRTDFFRAGDPIDVQLSGRSLTSLAAAAESVKEHLATYPTVFEIADSMSDGKEELRIELKPQGHVLGLTRNEVALQVSRAFQGFLVQRIQRGRDEVQVLVRLPPEERANVATLDEMLIRNAHRAAGSAGSCRDLESRSGTVPDHPDRRLSHPQRHRRGRQAEDQHDRSERATGAIPGPFAAAVSGHHLQDGGRGPGAAGILRQPADRRDHRAVRHVLHAGSAAQVLRTAAGGDVGHSVRIDRRRGRTLDDGVHALHVEP